MSLRHQVFTPEGQVVNNCDKKHAGKDGVLVGPWVSELYGGTALHRRGGWLVLRNTLVSAVCGSGLEAQKGPQLQNFRIPFFFEAGDLLSQGFSCEKKIPFPELTFPQ